jgi:lysophospholipase L1-like esterase
MSAPSRRRSALFALVVFVAFFGAVEGILRVVGVRRPARPRLMIRSIDTDVDLPFMRSDPELFWSLRPGYRGEHMGRPVTIDALGLRGPGLRRDPPPVRVLCLGDSITFGYGVGDDESYPAALARALASPQVEVVNGGVTGYTSHQVRRLFDRIAPAVRPDVVTVCIGWNDRTRRVATDREHERRMKRTAALERLADHLYLYRAMMTLYPRGRPAGTEEARRHARVPPGEYRENLEAVVRAARAIGARPAFIALPHRSRFEGPPLDDAYPTTLRAAAEALRVPLLGVGVLGDGAPPEGNEAFFIDSLHLSPTGAEEMARQLAPQMQAAGLLAPSAPR